MALKKVALLVKRHCQTYIDRLECYSDRIGKAFEDVIETPRGLLEQALLVRSIEREVGIYLRWKKPSEVYIFALYSAQS